ncbi:MAG TPA: DUF2207 domain-containing protein [Pseudogracilibacillus sp.]|nr:DUF2207 domain-containing protein [Pseudogracilibacillus sp.]
MKPYYFLIGIIFFALFAHPVQAENENELTNLYIHAYIHEDGSATITENRQMTVSEGTEGFIVHNNIGKSDITDFKVWRNGEPYTFEAEWNLDWDQDRKAGHHGIIEKSNGYELVWGLGNYGSHEYKLEYKVSNLVKELDDAQVIYWYFLSNNTNTPPKQVRVEIESEKPFSKENEKIWAYGYKGSIHFKNGKIVAENEKALKKENYIVILSQFEKGLFSTEDHLDTSFDALKKKADRGSDYSFLESIFYLIIGTAFVYFVIFYVIPFILGKIINLFKRFYYFRSPPKKYPEETIDTAPFDDDFVHIYALLEDKRLTNTYYITAALVMKWFIEDRIEVKTLQRRKLFFKREQAGFKIKSRKVDDMTLVERTFFKRFISAAKHKNNEFTLKDLKKDLKKNFKDLKRLKHNFYAYSIEYLRDEDFIVVEKERSGFSDKPKYHLTDSGKQLLKNVYLFMNHIRQFSQNDLPENISKEELKDYFVWASYLGLFKDFNEQIKLADIPMDFTWSHKYYFSIAAACNDISSTVISTNGSGGAASYFGGGGAFGGGGGGTR